MKSQGPLQSCVRALELHARGERRFVARQELGVCLCGIPLAEHFDHETNVLLPHAEHGIGPAPSSARAGTGEGKRNRRAA